MTFSEKLIHLRKSGGYTQEDLAEKLGVSRQAIARWEAGETTPDINTLLQLCDIFGVSADYMIHDDYESDEDIPAVKEKNGDIIAAKQKRAEACLFVSAIGLCCAIFSVYVAVTLTIIPFKIFFIFNTLFILFGVRRRFREYVEIKKELNNDKNQ